jgi:hypothetical protein
VCAFYRIGHRHALPGVLRASSDFGRKWTSCASVRRYYTQDARRTCTDPLHEPNMDDQQAANADAVAHCVSAAMQALYDAVVGARTAKRRIALIVYHWNRVLARLVQLLATLVIDSGTVVGIASGGENPADISNAVAAAATKLTQSCIALVEAMMASITGLFIVLAVSHGLVTVLENGTVNKSEDVLFDKHNGLLSLTLTFNHVQSTSHAPPAAASVNQSTSHAPPATTSVNPRGYHLSWNEPSVLALNCPLGYSIAHALPASRTCLV